MLRSPVDVGRVKGKKKNGKKKETGPSTTKARMQVRVVGLAALVSILFLVLAFRLWQLQVLSTDVYQNSAQATQTRSVKIPAQRGVIYDRNGEVLANNVPGLNVTIVPNAIPREKMEELADILNADKKEVLSRYDAAIESGNQYSPMLVKENVSREDVMYVSERTEEFKGLLVNDDYIRNYPNGELAAHVLGYTGAITEDELAGADGGIFEGLDNDAIVGKGGVELSYEKTLRGEPGKREYDVDALGRQVTIRRADGQPYDGNSEEIPEMGRPARITDPVPGKDLKLTVDLNLQKTVEKELDAAIQRSHENGSQGTGGAAIAIEPNSGEIMAMVSKPDFDPQMFVGGITGAKELQQYEYLNSEYAHSPFTDRAVQGGYPGASTFKPFTGMAGLEQGTISPWTTVTDTGACWRPTNSSWGCWQSWRENSPKYQYLGPHGTQNYVQALMDSNDKFFYQVADWMWNSTDDQNLLPKYYQQFGFGKQTGVDLPGESAGQVPTREWQEKAGATPDDKLWSVGRWVNISIGQGDLLVTPLQLLRGYTAIANGGTLVTPHVGLDIQDQNGQVAEKISPQSAGSLGVGEQIIQSTIDGLRRVTGPGGTAEDAFKGARLPMVGKTGTGEMGEHRDPVNYFVGWAENQKNPLVVLVMVEGGGAFEQGSEVTVAPAARNIIEAYYSAQGSSSSSSSSSGSSSSKKEDQPSSQSTVPTVAGRPPENQTGGSANVAATYVPTG